MKNMGRVGLFLIAILAMLTVQAFASTLDDVKKKGYLQCGVSPNLAGFSAADASGERKGFDVDFCRGLAAAIGVDVKFTPVTAKDRFPALQAGEVDVLYRNTTWTMNRDTKLGFDFAGINYIDGQGFLVRKSKGIKSAKQLNGATICVQTGTTTEKNLSDYFRSNKMTYKPLVFEDADPTRDAYDAGRCDAFTTDASGLASERTVLKKPQDHIILPEIISKEPLGPATRHGDNQWTDIVRWCFNAIVIAEEKGITQANVDQVKATSDDPEVKRMLGVTDTMGPDTGLPQDWAYKEIKAVGNYGEIFERNLGASTPLRLERGLNQLWTKGGILYVPPIR
jgi:general L-amino acid transport system substrate-binding protein